MIFKSIRSKITLAVFALVMICMSVTAYLVVSHSEQGVKQEIARQQFVLLKAFTSQIDQRIFEALGDLDAMAEAITPTMVADPASAQRFLDDRKDHQSFFNNALFLFSKSGILLAASPRDLNFIGSDFSSRPYFQQTIRTGKLCISEPFRSYQKTSTPVIVFTAPVYNRKGDIIAVLAGGVGLDDQCYFRSLAAQKLGGAGYLSLHDGNRIILMHPKGSQLLRQETPDESPMVQKALNGFAGTQETVDRDGTAVLRSVTTLKSTDWVLAISYPISEAYASLYSTRKFLLICGAIVSLMSSLAVWYLIRALTAPLLAFTTHLRQFAMGKQPRVIPLGGDDEIGTMTAAFNKMIDQLTEHQSQVREQKEFAESLIMDSSLPTFVIDPEHRVLFWNKACEELTGINRHDIVGTDGHCGAFYGHKRDCLADVIIDGRHDTLPLRHMICYPSKLVTDGWRCEGWYDHKDGETRYVVIDAAPIYNAGGEVIAAIETLQDITELKKTEQELERSRDFYLTLFENFPSLIWRAGTDGKCDYFNRTWLDFTGRTTEEERGDGWSEGVHPEDLQDCLTSYLTAFEKRKPFQLEYRLRRHDGVYRRIIDFGRPFNDWEGNFQGYIGSCYDITEREEAAGKILQLSRVIEQSSNTIVIAGLDGTVEYINHLPCANGPLTAEQLVGLNFQEILPSAIDADLKQDLLQAIGAGRELRCEIPRRGCNGERRWQQVQISAIRNQQGEITNAVAIIEDITARKQAEEDLRGSEERHRQMFSDNPHPMWAFDVETLFFLDVNNAAIQHYGYTREEFLSMTVKDIRPPEDVASFVSHLTGVVGDDGINEAGNWRHLRKDGSVILVDITSHFMNFSGRGARIVLAHDVTERRRLDEELRISEQRYRTIFDGVGDIIYSVDFDNSVVSFNHAFEKLTGRPSSAWSNADLRELVHPDDVPLLQGVYHNCLTGEEVAKFYFRIQTSSGELLQLEAHATPQFKNGEVAGMLGIARDVTERKRAEEKQEYLQRRLSAMWNIARMVDADFEALNEIVIKEIAVMTHSECGFLASVDEDRDEIAVKTWCCNEGEPAGAPQKVPTAQSGLWRMVLETKEVLIVNDYQAGDCQGLPLPGCPGAIARLIMVPVLFNNRVVAVSAAVNKVSRYTDMDAEQINAFIKNVQIILEKRRAEESLVKLSLAIDQSPVSVVITDADGMVEMANANFCKVNGYQQGEVVGKNLRTLQDKRVPQEEAAKMWSSIRSGTHWHGVLQKKRNDGGVWWEHVTVSPVRNQENTITNYIAIEEDITGRMHLEEQLRQSQKLEAIGTLAGGMAHDFNNILTAITGYCTLIQKKVAQEDPVQTYVKKLISCTERAAGLTGSLLAYSRKHPINPHPVDLNAILESAGLLLSRLVEEDIEISIVPAKEPLVVMADALQIEQVLMNLAANARDAMPRGGKLRITVTDTIFNEGARGADGRYALLTVADTGCGMDPQTQQKVFEPFFTTKEVGKGTGLGLSIVYGIIKQHQGYIDIHSQAGEGTRIGIYLPLIEEPMSRVRSDSLLPPANGNETLLLVEDDQEIRTTLSELLAEYGYRVIQAVDGEEGVRKFHEHKQELDLVILDVVMPKKNGREVFEEIKGTMSGIKALFISGYTADILNARGIAESEVNLITKPIAIDQLLAKIRTIMASR